MTTIYNAKKISKKDIEAKWYLEPTKYKYVREGRALACSPRFIPIKKNDYTYLGYTDKEGNKITKKVKLILVGIEKPKKISSRIWEIKYYWLKEYDEGCKYENIVYGPKSHWKGIIIPSEAVIII